MVQFYLLIMEDGTISHQDEITQSEIDAADDGYVQILSITDPSNPTYYYDGKWTPVKEGA